MPRTTLASSSAVIALVVGVVAAFASLFPGTCLVPFDENGVFGDDPAAGRCSHGVPFDFWHEDRTDDAPPFDDRSTELLAFTAPDFGGARDIDLLAMLADVLIWTIVAAVYRLALGPSLDPGRIRRSVLAAVVVVVASVPVTLVLHEPPVGYARADVIAGWPVGWLTFPSTLGTDWTVGAAEFLAVRAVWSIALVAAALALAASWVPQRPGR